MKPGWLKISLVIILLVSSCLKDEPFKLKYQGFAPKQINDDWQISTPENEQMDRNTLELAYRLVYQDDRYVMARSLLVIRNGKLVAEAYPHDSADINQPYNIQSCTKTFTSILAGIALMNHVLDSVNQKLKDIYPEHFTQFPERQNITLRHALSMKTGLVFNNDEHTLELYKTDKSSVEFVLSLDKLYEPGLVFHYNDGAPQLVSAAIQKRAGKSLKDYAREVLFEPLNINDILWETAKDGVTFGAVSLFIKPRDMAKIGQLLLQNGRWGDRQIVDSTWIQEATQIQGTGNFNGASYGYYFWIFPSWGGFGAEGHGGQFIYVVPLKNLVVVYTAWPYTSGEFFDQYTELMDLIIGSCY